MSTPAEDPTAALAAYDVGPLCELRPAGGTAGRTWQVRTAGGTFFLRRRGPRTSTEARLAFDHGLRAHLQEHGVPTATAVRTRQGQRWWRAAQGVYELYPLVHGQAFSPGHGEEVAAAARTLAGFHQAAAGYRPPGYQPESVAQYTTLGFSEAVSDRLDDPELQLATLDHVAGLAATAADGAAVERTRARLQRMRTAYAGPAYDRLCGWVVHGDYTPANLLFTPDHRVAGVFDLDWALPGARCRDVADGLYFFASQRRAVDGADIWSLTASVRFDTQLCRRFLAAYQAVAPLAPHELQAVPLGFCGRWISIRLEGMAKVPPPDRFCFFARDLDAPMEWLEANWADVARC